MSTKNKGCNNCANYKMPKLQFYGPEIPRQCLKGLDKEMGQWWEDNGRKKSDESLTEMSCFQETELGKLLNKVIELGDLLISK